MTILEKLNQEDREAWEDIVTTLRRGKTPNLLSERRQKAVLALAELLENEQKESWCNVNKNDQV